MTADADDSITENTEVHRTVFEAEQTGFTYVWYKTNYSQHSSWMSEYHLNMTEHVFDFWRADTTKDDQTSIVGYHSAPLYWSSFQSNTNILTEISNFFFSEAIPGDNARPGSSSRRAMARPKQNPVLLVKFIICKYAKPKRLVLDPFMDTGDSAKARLLKSWYQKLPDVSGYQLCGKSNASWPIRRCGTGFEHRIGRYRVTRIQNAANLCLLKQNSWITLLRPSIWILLSKSDPF